jgi:hypothetical protein
MSLVIGGIMFGVGTLWTLQGLDLVQGSAMSGETVWAAIGPFVGLVGLVIAFRGRRRS